MYNVNFRNVINYLDVWGGGGEEEVNKTKKDHPYHAHVILCTHLANVMCAETLMGTGTFKLVYAV